MLNARAIAVIAAALSCCSAAARGGDASPALAPTFTAPSSIALPETQALALLAAGVAGLAAWGRRRR
jgi:MYXO-CTERM domain-containing protein